MITSIELQVISRILMSDDVLEVDELCSLDTSYYSIFKPQIEFIYNHRDKYNEVPDIFTFQSEFPDITLVQVNEPLEYLLQEMRKNKKYIILLETFNKLKDLGSGDVEEAWHYLSNQCDIVASLSNDDPIDLIKDAKFRSNQIIEFNKQTRIPTGFPEIDKLMYGGLSTVEELVLIIARTGVGKSWVLTRMMESAQKNGFPVAYYSPEMQASYLGTRFDTWRGHYQNSQLFQGHYSAEYINYINQLPLTETPAFIIEDKDMAEGVSPRSLEPIVKKHGIKLLIIDGLSYMMDDRRSSNDSEKYKNICTDLFRLSKKYGCAIAIAVQANREAKNNVDEKGVPFPDLYHIESSDHPGRIATQAFALRQVFDQHVMDIRLEKSRMANNQKPVLSYAWDPNTGNMQYISGDESDDPISSQNLQVSTPLITQHYENNLEDLPEYGDDGFDELDEVEF